MRKIDRDASLKLIAWLIGKKRILHIKKEEVCRQKSKRCIKMGKSILDYTTEIYIKNFALIMLAAAPGLLGLIIPLVVGMPTYIALGGVYLRTGTIPDLQPLQAAVMIITLMISLYLMSFAIVGITLVVKRQRTLKKLSLEELGSIAKMTNSVFVVFVISAILLLLVQLLTFEYQIQRYVAPIANLIIGLGLLFMPTAIVMDDARMFRAMQKSFDLVGRKFVVVMQWIAIAIILLSVVDVVALFFVGLLEFVPHSIGPWLVMIFNSLVLMPFLIVMLAQIYISKYTILVD